MRAAFLLLAACAHTHTPDTFVRAEKIGCLGTCEVYTLTLYADGAVEYDGRFNVPLGKRWTKISPDDVARVMDEAERVPPWQCDPERYTYDLWPGGTVITVSRNGRITQHIEPYVGDPCTPDAANDVELDIEVVGRAGKFIGR